MDKKIIKIKSLNILGLTLILASFALTSCMAEEKVIHLHALDKADKEIVVEGNNKFAFDLYSQLKEEDGNLFFSPCSVSTALAMTYAGARGNTATQMADVLHFTLSQERLHPVFSELTQNLTADPERNSYQLAIANALWGQSGYEFYKEFINITKDYYDAGFKEVDYKDDRERERSRQKINLWVEDKTNDKIKELIKQGILTSLTRLVLTNAIYFKGNWVLQFNPEQTRNSLFTPIEGQEVDVPMMNQTAEFNYSENDILQVLEMSYAGDELSMIIFLPKQASGLKKVESLLTVEKMESWLATLRKQEVIISLPKFKMTSEFLLNKALVSLGMVDAFTMKADFSGMTPDPVGFYISKVIHKAFVDVNEEGTEAAAATAVFMLKRAAPMPKPIFRADHPFIFIIRDIQTNSILFLGRVTDPR